MRNTSTRTCLSGIPVQWVLDSYSPGGQKKDSTKSLKTLEKLGHRDLKLDEYESASRQACTITLVFNLA